MEKNQYGCRITINTMKYNSNMIDMKEKCVLHNKYLSILCYGIHKDVTELCDIECQWRSDNYSTIYKDVISHEL